MNQLKNKFLKETSKVILGKEKEFTIALCAYLSGGHILIEDIPGVGKTTFAKTLSKILGLHFSRIQFTSDLMPSDIVGAKIFNQKEHVFTLMKGPLFDQFILADELNRASPKTQSALLEAMEEGQITIDGECLILPKPFFVVATQNPQTQIGTHQLPESQLDRFIAKLSLGYPSPGDEKKLITGTNALENLKSIDTMIDPIEIEGIKQKINQILISEKLASYILEILNHSRKNDRFLPLSPRTGIDIAKMSRACAYLEGRDYVLPDDVKFILSPAIIHRLTSSKDGGSARAENNVQALIELAHVDT